MSMFAEEVGNPDGPPLLLVHGFLSSNAQWDLNRDVLGRHYRLIMVELLGHGRSEAPTDSAAYSADNLIGEFERIRSAHGIDTWWICGQSLGGAITILYCLANPEVARGLIFTNSRAAFGIKRQGVSQNDNGHVPELVSTRDLPVHPINAKRLPEPVKARMVQAADAMPLHAVKIFMARRHTWKSTDRMSELTMPVLLVNGQWESAFQPFAAQAQQLIAHFTQINVEGGHAINAEQPEAFDQAVIDFITENPQP